MTPTGQCGSSTMPCPISSICKNKDLVCFHLDDYIDDVQNTVLESRFRAYPFWMRRSGWWAPCPATICCGPAASR